MSGERCRCLDVPSVFPVGYKLGKAARMTDGTWGYYTEAINPCGKVRNGLACVLPADHGTTHSANLKWDDSICEEHATAVCECGPS